ncbi:DNA cytosine methyltransferase [Nonomuraea sp. NPDC049141]|uniref:DNA cytosine methyltransferase n=1 Tax=Nonomuraea sp. NPDC049141 TaxID=3155500 RepID=UPI0034060BB6
MAVANQTSHAARPAWLPERESNGRRVLDLFCCAGGAGMGYYLAGFEVTGVDIAPQPHYPFTFVRGDALDYLHAHGGDFDFIHTSPPCQGHSPLNAYNHKDYPDLIPATRTALRQVGRPYVIENVIQAPLINPMILCGAMFGLRVYRHRAFEAGGGFTFTAPPHPEHVARCVRNGYLPAADQFMTITGGRHSEAWRAKAAEVMRVPWTRTIREVCEAIPPAYTRHIGQAAHTACPPAPMEEVAA